MSGQSLLDKPVQVSSTCVVENGDWQRPGSLQAQPLLPVSKQAGDTKSPIASHKQLNDSVVSPQIAKVMLSENFGSQSSEWSQTSASTVTGIKVSYDMTPFSSTLSSLCPICRICQLPNEKNNILITPCRCDGSLKHVHGTCLRKWIEMRARKKKTEYPARCELCGYNYRKHKYMKRSQWRWPRMKLKDKVLHSVFLLSLVIMIACAIITIQCLISDSAQSGVKKFRMPNDNKPYLTVPELITLVCGVLFFITFIVAMLVEIKAKHTIYSMFRRFLRYNTVWVIENYRPECDIALRQKGKVSP